MSLEMSPALYGLYKTLKIFVFPVTWITISLVVTLVLLLGKPTPSRWKMARICAAFALGLFYCLSLGPTSTWLASILESQYPFPPEALQRYEAIVVLGGGVLPAGGARPLTELGPSTLRRTLCGVALLQENLAPVLVLSAGDAEPFATRPTESTEMQKLALHLGVPDSAIVIESVSRNTYESAKEVKKLLEPRSKILLVTSAIHIPRSMLLYAKQGFRPTAFPCGYSVGAISWHPLMFVPNVGALDLSSDAINEFLGIAVYRLAGKI